MPAPTPSAPFHLPRQERSRRTLDRLLAATEELLGERPFEAIPVSEIVRRAGTSVGAFYTRFDEKGALLPALYGRYDASLEERLGSFAGAGPTRGLAAVAADVAAFFVRSFRERRHLLAALALYVRMHPERIDGPTRARRRGQHEIFLEALLACRAEIRHPDPERAAELGLFFLVSACRDRILFAESPHAAATAVDDPELVRELARSLLGYLAYDPTRGPPGDPR